MKKTWEKPKLIILEKGRAEEAVLSGCKTGGVISSIETREANCLDTFLDLGGGGGMTFCVGGACNMDTPS